MHFFVTFAGTNICYRYEKVIYPPLWLLTAVLAVGTACQREVAVPEKDLFEKGLTFSRVPVNLGADNFDGQASSAPETRSVVDIQSVERFHDAILFVFYSDSEETTNLQSLRGKIVSVDGKPLIYETAEQQFSMDLPLEVDLDIYAIVNCGDNKEISAMKKNDLTVDELKTLNFVCEDSDALKKLESSGMPMAGVVHTRFTSEELSLTIKVKRLFARYDFYFVKDDLEEAGYQVTGMSISACRSNTMVPYFQEGYMVPHSSAGVQQVKTIDYGTEQDLVELNKGSKDHPVTLYFLENCQGNMSGASKWYEVYNKVRTYQAFMSYIDLRLEVESPEAKKDIFHYYIFLGSDCTTNFDVKRNVLKTIKLNLSLSPSIISQSGFKFVDNDVIVLAPGESVSVQFVTSESSKDKIFNEHNPEGLLSVTPPSSISTNTTGIYQYAYQGSFTVKAANNVPNGAEIKLVGGAGDACDTKIIKIDGSLRYFNANITRNYNIQSMKTLTDYRHMFQLMPTPASREIGITAPVDVTDKATWTVSPSASATIDKGMFRATKPGTYTIAASYTAPEDGYTYSKSLQFVIESETSHELVISSTKSSMYIGDITDLTATFNTYEDGFLKSSKDVTNTCVWDSADQGKGIQVNYAGAKGRALATRTDKTYVYYDVSASYDFGDKTYTDDYRLTVYPHVTVVAVGMDIKKDLGGNLSFRVILSEPVPFAFSVLDQGSGQSYSVPAGVTQTGYFSCQSMPSIAGCLPQTYYTGSTNYFLVWNSKTTDFHVDVTDYSTLEKGRIQVKAFYDEYVGYSVTSGLEPRSGKILLRRINITSDCSWNDDSISKDVDYDSYGGRSYGNPKNATGVLNLTCVWNGSLQGVSVSPESTRTIKLHWPPTDPTVKKIYISWDDGMLSIPGSLVARDKPQYVSGWAYVNIPTEIYIYTNPLPSGENSYWTMQKGEYRTFGRYIEKQSTGYSVLDIEALNCISQKEHNKYYDYESNTIYEFVIG